MAVSWIEALKKWNAEREGQKWSIPRKGTPEHEQVMKIMYAVSKKK